LCEAVGYAAGVVLSGTTRGAEALRFGIEAAGVDVAVAIVAARWAHYEAFSEAVRVVSAAPAGEPRRPPRFLTQTLVNDLPKQIVVGPDQVLDLGDQLRPHSMHAAEHSNNLKAKLGCYSMGRV
jgi:hypothetical protein